MYKEIPERFQPKAIVGNDYYFDDGVYERVYVRDYLHPVLQEIVGQPGYGLYDNSVQVVELALDDSGGILQGSRKVRNVVAEIEMHVYSVQGNYWLQGRYTFELVVARQSQTTIYRRDILSCYDGCWFYLPGSTTGVAVEGDEDKVRVAYPGTVELESGDRLLLRITLLAHRNYANTAIDLSFCSSALVKY